MLAPWLPPVTRIFERRELVERRKGHLTEPLDLGAHGIADEHAFVAVPGFQPVDLVISNADRHRIAGKQAIDPAQHRILLVEHGRDVERAGREQGRKGGIAAEADHRVGTMIAIDVLRLRPPADDGVQGLEPADRTAAEPAGRKDMDRHVLEQAREARAAVVGDEQHLVPARLQFGGERVGRDHMSAGPAGGQDEVHVVSDSPLHFTT